MRSFEQRMEEIQRRSEKIKKQRKNRLYIAVATMPAVMCVILLSALVLPKMIPETVVEPGLENNQVTQTVQSVRNSIAYVQITGGGVSYTVYDSELTQQIGVLLNGSALSEMNKQETVESQAEMSDSYKEILTDENKVDDMVSNSSVFVYTVILHMNNGDTIEYHLIGNQLKCQESSDTRILNKAELTDLKELLGIS